MEQENTAETSGDGGFTPAPLSDILRGGSEPAPREPAGRQATEAPSEGSAETGDKSVDLTKAPARDESGRFAPKADQQEAGPPPEAKQDAPPPVPVAALLEERKKRQALEVRLKEMEARLAAPPAPAPTVAPATPEVPLEDLMFQDPQRFIQAVRAPLEDQLVQTRLAMSEANARREPDFEETTSAFHAYVEANPHLKDSVRQALRSHPDPARWAVEQGRALLAEQRWGSVVSQYGTPEAFLAAQHQQQAAAPIAQASAPPTPPGSLASVRSAGPRGVPAWNGPTPISNIFGGRR
jgi:hypothetical protein